MSIDVEQDPEVEALIAQRLQQLGRRFDWADYEIRAIRGEGGFAEHAVSALGFHYEDFGMRLAQAVSCTECGAHFRDQLTFMRRHRLQCGWTVSG